MTTPSVVLRPATPADVELLWSWSNDPTTRARAFDPRPIPWSTHVQWLQEQLLDPRTELYVALDDHGAEVGQVRLDRNESGQVISVSVCSEARGHGLGVALIRAATTKVIGDVHAFVKADNVVSRKAFSRAGFDEVEDDGAVVHFVWPPALSVSSEATAD